MSKPDRRPVWALAWASCWLLCCADIRATRAGDPLRVGTSGDYAPFSQRVSGPPGGESGRLVGFDIDLARRFARDSGRELQLETFRWPELLRGLAADEFDLAMSGVTVRPDRSLAGRFSVPVAESGALLLVRQADGYADLDAIDRPEVAIAVNRGGHLERVARGRFARAQLQPIERNQEVMDELLAGRVQAVVTDTLEAPHWLAREAGVVSLGPFTHDQKAYLVRADRPELARELDAWLLARERDGTLARLRRDHFGPGPWRRTATPDAALASSLDERLALMPLVAEAKRRSGAAVEDREREERVLEAAITSVARSAAARGVEPPEPAETRQFFRQQIDAAKRVQHEVLELPADPALPPADLQGEIRPALIRIGDRIAALLVERATRLRAAGE